MARRTFVRRHIDTNFKELDENALYLPEHEPETWEFVLKWMYEKQLGVSEYCEVLFATHQKVSEGREAAFLLLCRIYILADYLNISEIIDPVMDDLSNTLLSDQDGRCSPIGPEAVQITFRNTIEGSRLQEFVLKNLAESLVYNMNGRPIEEYTQCFDELEGFGAVIMRRVLELHAKCMNKATW